MACEPIVENRPSGTPKCAVNPRGRHGKQHGRPHVDARLCGAVRHEGADDDQSWEWSRLGCGGAEFGEDRYRERLAGLRPWGWIHLIVGVVVTLAGAALFQGATWARAVGVAAAGLAMLANFLWIQGTVRHPASARSRMCAASRKALPPDGRKGL
ncbi:DUF7144 family membrane protein [Streptomyces canus]|uniref:DUF7144 family membrane protein n=1 Tax=Streptomyces canus TaxID=58343 RepID=UPI003F4C88AD